jgi:predicted nucleic acid-binding protein
LDLPTAERFGRLKTGLERDGNILADADLIIAAITLAQGAGLVTRKLKQGAGRPDGPVSQRRSYLIP